MQKFLLIQHITDENSTNQVYRIIFSTSNINILKKRDFHLEFGGNSENDFQIIPIREMEEYMIDCLIGPPMSKMKNLRKYQTINNPINGTYYVSEMNYELVEENKEEKIVVSYYILTDIGKACIKKNLYLKRAYMHVRTWLEERYDEYDTPDLTCKEIIQESINFPIPIKITIESRYDGEIEIIDEFWQV